MNDVIIKVENLCKVFKLYDHPKDRLKEALSPGRKKYHHEYYALKGVSFEVERGESVGILGKNGAGKSTLLKILTRVLTPTTGCVSVSGRIAALLELGSGFNPELSGMENIFFQGAIMGFTKEDMEKKVPEIVEFADIGEFIEQPVKIYSSGMFARLAFSIAINVEPDILIVDEALSVGDAYFQAKCFIKIKELKEKKKLTLLFVSHSTSAIRSLCTKAILLVNGQVMSSGSAGDVAEKYFQDNVTSSQTVINKTVSLPDVFDRKSSYGRIRNGLAEFTNIEMLNVNGKVIKIVNYGEKVNLKMSVIIHEPAESIAFGFHIRNQDGVDVLFSSSGVDVDFLEKLESGMTIDIQNMFYLNLIQGTYTIAAVLSRPIDIENGIVDFCDFIPIAYDFEMCKRQPVPIYGLVGITNHSLISYKAKPNLL